MPHKQFNRSKLTLRPLAGRRNLIDIERDHVPLDASPGKLSADVKAITKETADRIRSARDKGCAVILTFGAHAIKNGLGPILINLAEDGWVTHLATNGAGVIHDWEFAFQGQSSEDVRTSIKDGSFGTWEETGRYLNLALIVGAYRGLGYGESVGEMIHNDGLEIPGADELKKTIVADLDTDPAQSAAAADLLATIREFDIQPGRLVVEHPYKKYSVQEAARRLSMPFTGHPMIGQDVIYTHPINQGAAIGRTGLSDFLAFANSMSNLDGGVYLSVGSAIMSPMIFEKALTMCRNVRDQENGSISDHYIVVADITQPGDGWKGAEEPSKSDPAYYVRSMKTFSRAGGTMRYACSDNRDFLLALRSELGQ